MLPSVLSSLSQIQILLFTHDNIVPGDKSKVMLRSSVNQGMWVSEVPSGMTTCSVNKSFQQVCFCDSEWYCFVLFVHLIGVTSRVGSFVYVYLRVLQW